MTHSFRTSSMRWLHAGFVGLCLAAGALAGTTGKITGTVTSSQGGPLPGVGVTIDGTRLGASTDADGRYIILQVPPGSHTVSAQLIGYRTVTTRAVGVNADRTSNVDFSLPEEAVEVDAVLVTAERPPIEADVTSSQTIIGAAQVADAPVAEVLDYMAYEPGVSIAKDNELRIRGGGAEEIRFQVDDMDRTDALTSKGLTHLNLTLVAEVTLLTGGFNAEYGNMRSGVVNAVYKDGTERGWGVPWASVVYSRTPTARKHFGPGAYDPEQYDYQIMGDPAVTGAMMPKRDAQGYVLDADSNRVVDSGQAAATTPLDNVGKVHWPDLYEETWGDTAFQQLWWGAKSQFEVWKGWQTRAAQSLFFGGFSKYDWTPEQMREVWQWEANMNEEMWQYGNKPDWNIDLSVGQALPNRLGGIVVGYSYAKKMTPVPALRPYYTDRTVDAKLTLTPIDQLKIRLSYLLGANRATGSGARPAVDELSQTGGGTVYGNDPVALRDPGSLINSLDGGGEHGPNNKLNLSYNSMLDGDYSQIGANVTFTLNPTTFMEVGVGRLVTDWTQPREPPRANPLDFSGKFAPTNSFAWGGKNGFLHQVVGSPVFIWKPLEEWTQDENGQYVQVMSTSDPTKVNMVNYPTRPEQITPDNIIPRSPFDWREPYDPTAIDKLQEETAAQWERIHRDFYFDTDGDGINDDTVTAVSPQGWWEQDVNDLSGTLNVGGHRKDVFDHRAESFVVRGSMTHQRDEHTFKLGGEFTMSSIDFDWSSVNPIMRGYSRTRDYMADPRVGGLYIQDKFESRGMIINVGARADYFDPGAPVYTPDNIFDTQYWRQGQFGGAILDSLKGVAAYSGRFWPLDPRIQLPANTAYEDYNWPTDPVTPAELRTHIPSEPANTHFKLSPRVGISHPVSETAKLFFNYGHFYNMAQGKYMYGLGFYEGPMGNPQAAVRDVEYANLRPIKTTMYEVGIEQMFPVIRLLATVRGYAKYNVDQISHVSVHPKGGQGYSSYRNSNYEDLQGLEIKLSRMHGRHLFGWATYNYVARKQGQYGIQALTNDPAGDPKLWPAQPVTSNSPDNFQALAGVRSPSEWGPLAGGWSASVLQTWSEGGEVIYNPENVARRFLPDEYIMKAVDYWNTNLKFQKLVSLPGGRMVSLYLDIYNVWNTKRNRLGSADFQWYIVDRRTRGGEPNLRYNDESTWHVFNRPYKDVGGNWHRPLKPEQEWVQFTDPRSYRFGVRVNL